MGTPLRLLASSKCKLSVSPVRHVKSCGRVDYVSRSPLRNRNAAKRLNFSGSIENCTANGEKYRFPQENIPKILVNGPEKQKKRKCLAINTPEKTKLLKCGLQNRNVCNIIGAGSFGTVIEATYKGRSVAVKIIAKPESSNNIAELNALGLEHENVIKTVDVIFRSNYNHCVIVMEYFENTTPLNCILENKRVDVEFETVLKIATDVSKGLLYLHENNLVHLDIKPANVLVCPDGLCKLCDFGSCIKLKSDRNINYAKHKGTVIYTCPEILLGKIPTLKSDVYSLGILMWQLLTRETPFADIDSSEVLIYKVVKYKLRPDVSKCNSNSAYVQLFCECWDSDPSIRPQVAVVIKKLQQISLRDTC